MKGIKLLVAVLSLTAVIIIGLGIWFFFFRQPALTLEEREAEKIILTYIDTKNINIKQGTKEYGFFLREILLGEHPELTRENSIFVNSENMRNAIISYAGKYMVYELKIKPDFRQPSPAPTDLK